MTGERVVEIADGRVQGEVPAGRAAIFDRAWLGDEPASVAALEVELRDGSYGGTLTALAESAVAAATGQAVMVLGDGAVAAEASRILRSQHRAAASGDASPSSVIDTTGDPERVRQALETAAPMGSVVLAGEASGRRYELDLYTDVHTRGLRVKGVPRPAADAPAPPEPLTGGQELRSGDALDSAALFYVLLPS